MSDCAKTRVLKKDCPPAPEPLPDCEPVSFCAGNYSVNFDGRCLHVEPNANPLPDGTYSTFTLEDGCIVGVGTAPLPEYTPSDCCAAPNTGGGSSQTLVISPDPSNILQLLPDGLAVLPVFRGEEGIDVSGAGTATNPITIKYAGPSSGGSPISTLTPSSVEITSDPVTDTTFVSLAEVFDFGTYAGFTVNDYGQIVGYSSDEEPVVDVRVGEGLEVQREGNVVMVSLAPTNTSVGGFFDTVDGKRVFFNVDGIIIAMTDEAGDPPP